MFRELFGLPAHALIVHAAVVFIPLAVLAAILYAVWPGVRKHIWWATIGLGALSPLTGWAARLSGEQYKKWWVEERGATGDLVADIEKHQSFGTPLAWWATGLGVAVLVMVLYAIPGPVALGRNNSRIVQWVVGVVSVAVAVVTLYYVIRTGDSGAHTSHNEI